jgi:hypothetical protein
LPENSGEQPTTYVDVGLAAPRAPEPEGLAVGGLPMMMLPGAVGPSGGPDFGGGDGVGGRPRADTVMSEEDENELDAAVCGDDYVDGDLQLMAQVVLGTLPFPSLSPFFVPCTACDQYSSATQFRIREINIK